MGRPWMYSAIFRAAIVLPVMGLGEAKIQLWAGNLGDTWQPMWTKLLAKKTCIYQ